MPRTVKTLRTIWIALMVLFALLILTGNIGGYGTVLFAAVILGVMFAEMRARQRA
jgi:hypothetical protein